MVKLSNERAQQIYEDLVRRCLPRHPTPNVEPKPEGNVVVLPKPLSDEERWRLACQHGRALLRVLREKQFASERPTTIELAMNTAFERAAAQQDALDELYSRTCVRGPGDSDWGPL
jgi:hypothetical protein